MARVLRDSWLLRSSILPPLLVRALNSKFLELMF
jgi:hypothetical protein